MYYFYTPDYSEWHAHFQRELSTHFTLRPILLPKLEIHDQHPRHHFTGSTKKLELVVDAVRTNLGTRIVFSDVTWYFSSARVPELASLLETCGPMAFAQNEDGPDLNIGLFVLDCTESALALWSEALRRCPGRCKPTRPDRRGVSERRTPYSGALAEPANPLQRVVARARQAPSVRDSFRRHVMAQYGYTLPPDPTAAQYLCALPP